MKKEEPKQEILENLKNQLKKVIKEHPIDVNEDTYWRGVKIGLETAIEVLKLHKAEINQAKEMEKQQIVDAYNKGCSEIHLYYEFIKDENITQTKEPFSAEQYYNETFNK